MHAFSLNQTIQRRTLSAIQQAHQQFTGVDFPKLFKAFKDMGMTYNIVNIQDGTATYVHQSEDDIVTSSIKSNHPVAPRSNQSIVQDVLTRHQQGQTDFETFCDEMAEAGIYKWHIDIQAGTCTYIDLKEQAIISELIPQ
ncbi:TPA: DUF1398 domain-containing protein [Staphylococcus aureus]|nr:DUF1398 domain-containing protein [Staphylococcus aureus]